MRLSILNFLSYPHEIPQLVETCDAISCFDRFWMGEHHTVGQVPDPLSLAFVAAGVTDRIRIGTGATSLYLRNPYLVAETALMLEVFYPGRIDIGVSKAVTIPDKAIAELILSGLDVAHLERSYQERLLLLRNVLARVTDLPSYLDTIVRRGPPMYVMGTSILRAQHTGTLGVGYVASFHHGSTASDICAQIRHYRDSFVPSPLMSSPHAIVVVSGLVSNDSHALDAARQVAESSDRLLATASQMVFGPAQEAAKRLRDLAELVEADELMFLAVARDCIDCYRDLAEGWAALDA